MTWSAPSPTPDPSPEPSPNPGPSPSPFPSNTIVDYSTVKVKSLKELFI